MNDKMKGSQKRKRKWVWVFVCLLLVVAVFVWFLPTVIAKTALRDRVLNAIANAPQYELSSRDASLGWFSPLVVDDLEITKFDKSSTLRIQKLSAENSWFELWLSSPDLGSFTIIRPQLDVVVANDETAEDSADDATPNSVPSLNAVIKNAHVVVRNEKNSQPEIDIDNINLAIKFENTDSVSFLNVEPIQIFERLEMTDELCNQGLQLIAPVLENEVNIKGSMSLEFRNMRIPLDVSQNNFVRLVEVEGVFQLHRLSAGIRNEVTKRLAMMFAELLELGEMPDEWKIVDEATINFQVREGRVFHDSLALILPDISPDFAIRTSGSVSIDGNIDLNVNCKLPTALLGENPLARKISQTPIDIRISGSIPELKIGLPSDPRWVVALSDDLLSNSLNAEEKELSQVMLEFIAELQSESVDQSAKLPAQLLEKIHNLRPPLPPKRFRPHAQLQADPWWTLRNRRLVLASSFCWSKRAPAKSQ